MTEQQASKIRSCFANGVEFKEEIGIPDEYQKLADLMNDAIKKQIRRKPTMVEGSYTRYTACYICPRCNKRFTGTGVAAYCYHCGQALDWEVEK